MCSINGFTWEDKKLIKEMNEILKHRGPDDNGIFIDKNISLGHNRLSIIDLSKAGHQPMSNEDNSIWIIFNGEIYNYVKLRNYLEKLGYNFQSDTDTETIIYAYEEFGEDCLKLFNGMFAFAIWDSKKKSLFLARDRLGIKPLYYYHLNGKLIFSSEIKAILKHNIDKSIDKKCLNSFLKYRFIPSNKTIIKNLKKILPGHYAVFKNGNLKIQKYWNLNWEISEKPINYYLKRLDNLVTSSIKLRLRSDVSLGAFLSGGVDSSLVVAINSRLINKPVKTFTVGFGHETDEFKYARIVSEYLSTDHHEIILNYKKITRELPNIIWHMDEPHSEITIVPLYFLSEFAKSEVTVVNTGEGADELFSGYSPYYIGSSIFKPIPSILKKEFYLWYYCVFKNNERKKLLKENYSNDEILRYYLNNSNYPQYPKQFLNKLLNFDIKHELPNWELNRTDKMTMAHSLEARVPFLDHRIVNLSSKMPIRYKQSNLTNKFILKKYALNFLPKDIVNRKKQGFFVPMHSWLKHDLEDIIEKILLQEKNELFERDYVNKLIKKHKKLTKPKPFMYLSFQLLILLFFNIWYEMYINEKSTSYFQNILRI